MGCYRRLTSKVISFNQLNLLGLQLLCHKNFETIEPARLTSKNNKLFVASPYFFFVSPKTCVHSDNAFDQTSGSSRKNENTGGFMCSDFDARRSSAADTFQILETDGISSALAHSNWGSRLFLSNWTVSHLSNFVF